MAALLARLSPVQRQRLHRWYRPAWLGMLRRTTPLSNEWGIDRGTPIDRHYIEHFLAEHRSDIHGVVLEVRDGSYAGRFGRDVVRCDVLDIDPSNPQATIVADLAAADVVPTETFDCFVLTQTLQFIYDTRGAIGHAHRILRTGGVLLATVPSVSRVAPRRGRDTDCWRFTALACSRLFGDVFGARNVIVRAYGNVLTGIGFLAGLAAEELTAAELAEDDPDFPLVVTVRAVKG
jgi:hypothetical protein